MIHTLSHHMQCNPLQCHSLLAICCLHCLLLLPTATVRTIFFRFLIFFSVFSSTLLASVLCSRKEKTTESVFHDLFISFAYMWRNFPYALHSILTFLLSFFLLSSKQTHSNTPSFHFIKPNMGLMCCYLRKLCMLIKT